MTEETGHMYRVVGRDRNGIVFQRCSERPLAFQQFKSVRHYRRLHLDANPHREGHTYIFKGGWSNGIFGLFLPDTANREAVLRQVKSRWGLASEIRKELWDRTKPAFARA